MPATSPTVTPALVPEAGNPAVIPVLQSTEPIILAEAPATAPRPPVIPSTPRRKRKKKKEAGLDIETGIGQGGMLLLVLLLGVTPLFPWVFREKEYNRYENKMVGGRLDASFITTHARPPSLQGIESWQGKVVLGLSLTAFLFAGGVVLIATFVRHPVVHVLLDVSTSLLGAWGGCVLLYLIATLIKAFAVSGEEKTDAGTEIVRIVPHLGIWFGLLLALALFGLSCALTQRRGRTWGLMVCAGGIFAGLIVAFVLVQPWNGKSLDGLPQGTGDFGTGETHDRGSWY
jgi:hypothetical protein